MRWGQRLDNQQHQQYGPASGKRSLFISLLGVSGEAVEGQKAGSSMALDKVYASTMRSISRPGIPVQPSALGCDDAGKLERIQTVLCP